MKTILCYGDSNTYGYNPLDSGRYSKEIRWTTILQHLLGKQYEVIDEGLNGRTTAFDVPDGGAYKNGLTPIKTILGSHKPMDYLIIMLGTNDCNKQLKLSAKDIAEGMEKLIVKAIEDLEYLQGYIPKIILVTPAAIADNFESSPFIDQLDQNAVNKSRALAPLYKELADKYDLLYLDNTNAEVSPLDSEHLTIKSHVELANKLADLIKYN